MSNVLHVLHTIGANRTQLCHSSQIIEYSHISEGSFYLRNVIDHAEIARIHKSVDSIFVYTATKFDKFEWRQRDVYVYMYKYLCMACTVTLFAQIGHNSADT